MANILDYLDWRGDLTLAQAPFNEVDNLLLAELAFVDFRGIVPENGQSVLLRHAAAAFFARHCGAGEIDMGLLVPDVIPVMLRKMAASRRFGDMKLSCYEDRLDVGKAEQFAALAVDTGDGSLYLAFRGTDDTLAGWKEDFLLSCMPEVPAQKKAAEYTLRAALLYPGRWLRLGGHSKGGNLAVYAAARVPEPVQGRITAVYSNDGPGFQPEFLRSAGYLRMEPKILSIVPKSSVVGMLLEHSADYTVVDSDQLGFFQHDGFSWQVKGRGFVKLGRVNPQVEVNDRELREWLLSCPPERREKFVDAMFDVLSASGAKTLSDLKAESLGGTVAMIRAMQGLDKETRDGLVSFAALLFKGNLRLVYGDLREETEGRTDQLKESLRQTWEETGRRAEETGDRLKEGIRQALEETGRKAEETGDRLKESIRQALEETGRKAGETGDRLKEGIRQTLEETGRRAEEKTEGAARLLGLKKKDGGSK